MIDFVLSLSTWAGCVVTMGFTAVAGFAVYLVFYKLILKYKRESMRDPDLQYIPRGWYARKLNARVGIFGSHR